MVEAVSTFLRASNGMKSDFDQGIIYNVLGLKVRRTSGVYIKRSIILAVFHMFALTSLKYFFNFSMLVSDAGQPITNPSCWFGLGI